MAKLVVANWKANVPEISNFQLLISNDLEIGVAEAYPFIDKLPPEVTRVAQDVSQFPPGAYTGEVTAEMLKSLDVKYCLVGHSERRRYFKETNEIIQEKINRLKENNIMPIICARNESEVVDRGCVIMFEPETAISTPGNFHPEDPGVVEKIITGWKNEFNTKVLYGGSLNFKNIHNYLSADGFVVGQASLNPDSFYELLCQIKA